MNASVPLPLEDLAAKLFTNLSEADRRLLRGVRAGTTAFCGAAENEDNPTYEPANDPASAAGWGADRTISADLIRWLCVDRIASTYLDPRGIQICGARISGKLDLSYVTVSFPIRFDRCVFEADTYLSYLKTPELAFTGCRMKEVTADGAAIGGDLSYDEGFLSEGGVRMLTAQVGGNLECNGGRFQNRTGHALWADRVKVAGSVFLGKLEKPDSPFNGASFEATGTVRLVGAQLGGVLSCAGGKFQRPQPPAAPNAPPKPVAGPHRQGAVFALLCDRMKAGNVFLRGGFSAVGEVRLWGSDIGISLICSGNFSNPEGNALSAEGAKLGGGVYLDRDFTAQGVVDLLNCQIGGDVECIGGSLTKLSLVRATIKGSLIWSEIQNADQVVLDLTNATTGPLQDSAQSWPGKNRLTLDGFCYSRISQGAPTDVTSRLRWLKLPELFTLQPYQQLAKVLRDAGDKNGPPRVLFAMEHQRRNSQHRDVLQHVSGAILRWTIGYGVMPLRALWWLLGLILLGSIFFGMGYLGGAVAPSDKDAYACFKQERYPPDNYPGFNPLVYSVERSFPVINLGVRDHWQPSAVGVQPLLASPVWQHCRDAGFSVNSAGFLWVWMWCQTIAGWILATLFVAGFTGLVKTA